MNIFCSNKLAKGRMRVRDSGAYHFHTLAPKSLSLFGSDFHSWCLIQNKDEEALCFSQCEYNINQSL